MMGCLQSRIVCQHVQIHLIMCQLAVHICAMLKVMLIVKQFVGQAVMVQTQKEMQMTYYRDSRKMLKNDFCRRFLWKKPPELQAF